VYVEQKHIGFVGWEKARKIIDEFRILNVNTDINRKRSNHSKLPPPETKSPHPAKYLDTPNVAQKRMMLYHFKFTYS